MSWAGQATLREAAAISEAAVDDLETVVRAHARLVYQVAYSVLRHREDAEDAAQETFVRLLRQDLRQIDDPRLWLARVAWRCALDRVRKRREQPLEEASSELPATGRAADDLVFETEMKGLLVRMISALPRDLCDVVTLSTVEEMSSADMARVLDIPETSVRTRLFRARQLLREKLLAALEKKS